MYRPLALAVVLLALVFALFWVIRRSPAPAPGGGPLARIEVVQGTTVVRLAGPPRDKGRALGQLLKDRIRAELARVLPEDPGVREFVVSSCGERLMGFLPDTYRAEIEGIAKGAGISFPEALFLNTRFELAAFGLAGGEGDLLGEGAVGPGPEVAKLFPEDARRDLVVVIHEDLDPPLVLLCRPGMAGAFLGVAGPWAAVMRPITSDTAPPLKGLVWTLLLRRMLERPPEGRFDPPAEMTGPVSVAMALPGGNAGTFNLALWGASWYPADGPHTTTTDEVVGTRAGGMLLGRREPDVSTRIAADAARLLQGPPPAGTAILGFRGGEGASLLGIDGNEGRVVTLLMGPG